MSKRKAIMAVWLILCDILAFCISVEVTDCNYTLLLDGQESYGELPKLHNGQGFSRPEMYSENRERMGIK